MNIKRYVLISLFGLVSIASFADPSKDKQVYSYQNNQGIPVFTDAKPEKKKKFKTQTFDVINTATSSQTVSRQVPASDVQQTQRVIVEHHIVKQESNASPIKEKKKRRCKFYRKKLDYFSDKMRSGYRSSEYKYLKTNYAKYRRLLFKNCETSAFRDE